MKDPNSTIERLTKALESMATGGSTSRRAQDLYVDLAPLNASEFPNEAARALFEKIISFGDREASSSLEDFEEMFTNVWDLYWLMTSNQQYR